MHVQKATGLGGSERHLVDLLSGQLRRGLDVQMCVLATGDSSRFESALADAAVPARSFPAGTTVSPAVLARLIREMRRFRPDLVHTHLIHADVHGQLVARLLGVPAVSTIHGPQPFYRRHPAREAAQLAARLARRTIVISNYLGSVVVEWGLVPAERVRVVPYGADVSRWALPEDSRRTERAKLGLDGDQVVIGIASRLIQGKGHEMLIEAVGLARKSVPSIVLLVAGDGDRRSSLEQRAARHAPDAVRFVGFLADVGPLIHACDVVAVPTQPQLGEGFGLVALEAMACARPVVVTDTASLPEVVVNGETGLVVPPDDVNALADALVRLCDPGLRQRMGEAGRARAVTRFSLEAMVTRTIDVYEEALATGRPSRTGRN